jgi:hypothetical protein
LSPYYVRTISAVGVHGPDANSENADMPKHCLSIGLAALAAAAVLLPAQAEADHENRYFGFGFPFFSPYNPPPPVYYPPPGVRETAPGVYEYETAPGHWVKVRPGHNYQPRKWRQPQQAVRTPAPPPVPKQKPDADEPDIEVGTAPAAMPPQQMTEPDSQPAPEPSLAQQVPAAATGDAMSCEAAIEIVESFGFTDVRSTSCNGDVYGFDAARDGDAYAIKLSAADGALTEVRKR